MNAVVTTRTDYTGAQMALIKRTVAKDTNADEFDLFMSIAKMKGLDPFSKQISAIVFNKAKADKRNMSVITTIDGMRAIAARSKAYRPDEDEPEFTYEPDLKSPVNPLGLLKARVRIWIADTVNAGGWKPATGVAYWEEFAPIKEEWAENPETGKFKPTGKLTLDTGGNWGKMPRIMLAKCAEAQALRKAFPEDLSGLYESAELDRAQIVDVTATEIIGAFETENRLARLGLVNTVTLQLSPTSPLEPIELGKVYDRIDEAARDWDLQTLRWFESANTNPLREFWARQQADALELKKLLEATRARLMAEEKAPA
jgi:phage recombination protein Bet